MRINNLFVFVLILLSFAFAEQKSIYELDGQIINSYNKTNGPKASVSVKKSTYPKSLFVYNLEQEYNLFFLTDSLQWEEVEKNQSYSICKDSLIVGKWFISNVEYKFIDANCILINTGNYVKTSKISFFDNIGNVYSINLLIGMKYLDLNSRKHMLGYYGPEYKKREPYFYLDPKSEVNNRIYPDSLRYEKIDEVLTVDKYKVTVCEIIQTLWDSIPDIIADKMSENQKFWIEQKKKSKRGDLCAAHDSAAIRVNPYLAFIYANERSVRDGLTPVYSFVESDEWKSMRFYEDGSFGIKKESPSILDIEKRNYVIVHVNKESNGYRLPYYNEWMAMARGEQANREYIWGNESDSLLATQFAWFGIQNPEDPLKKMNSQKPFERRWLKHSCGRWIQESRPVGELKANAYGLYDISGLVCELVMLPGKSIFNNEVLSCKGGFMSDSLKSLNLGMHCDYSLSNDFIYQGLRLVRQIR